jgi:hypothetical protein
MVESVIGAALLIGCIEMVPAQHNLGPPPQGLFVLNDDNGPWPLPDWVFRDELAAGVSLRGAWGQVEPTEGKFIWFFDGDIGRAKKAGKKVILRVHTGFLGRRMAAWVYQAGAEKFEFSDDGQRSTPVPWDRTHLAKWKALVRALGRKYGHEDAVVLVQLAGLDVSGGEMHLPKTPQDRERWRRSGYTREKLVGAWREVVDAYADALPGKYLGLNVSLPVYQDGVVEAVLAHARKRLGRRLCVQHNALAAKTAEGGYPHRWVLSCRGEAVLGFQELCPVTPRGAFNDEGRRFGGTLERALDIGMRAGMRYLEVYPPDMGNESLRPVLRACVTKLNGAGPRRP